MSNLASQLSLAAVRVSWWLVLAALVAGVPRVAAQGVPTAKVPFTLTISGGSDDPRFEFVNRSRLTVNRLRITSGHQLFTFDRVDSISTTGGAEVNSQSPTNTVGGDHSQTIDLSISGCGPGAKVSLRTDIDLLLFGLGAPISVSANYRTVLFNNGSQPNAVVTVDTVEGISETLTLSDNANNPNAATYEFSKGARKLLISSVAESGDIVGRVDVRSFPTPTAKVANSILLATNVGSPQQLEVFDGETVEIRAVREVYFNIHGEDITTAVAGNPAAIQSDAEERFTAFGISVNNQPQTGDPTLYRFEVTGDTVIEAKWKHDYALTVSHDFARTESLDRIADKPWAGPLTSAATGNPDPPAQKHWIQRGTTFIARIDGQVADLTSRPGLPIRYVPKAYFSYGPPNRDTSSATGDRNKRLAVGGQRVDIRADATTFTSKSFNVGQTPPQKQQVPEFTMHGPGGIR